MGFLKVFDLVPGWVWAMLLTGALLSTCAQRGMLLEERGAHAATKVSFKDYEARMERRENERAQTALVEAENQRELERNRRLAAQEAQNVLLAETARTAAARAAADTRRSLLGQTIDALTAPSAAGGQVSGDTAALRRAEETAAVLGRLLKACRAEGDGDAGELEQLAGQIRGLITQYEGLLAPPPKPGSPVG